MKVNNVVMLKPVVVVLLLLPPLPPMMTTKVLIFMQIIIHQDSLIKNPDSKVGQAVQESLISGNSLFFVSGRYSLETWPHFSSLLL